MAGAAALPGRVENSIDARRSSIASQGNSHSNTFQIEDAEGTCEPQRHNRRAPLAFLPCHAVPSAGNPAHPKTPGAAEVLLESAAPGEQPHRPGHRQPVTSLFTPNEGRPEDASRQSPVRVGRLAGKGRSRALPPYPVLFTYPGRLPSAQKPPAPWPYNSLLYRNAPPQTADAPAQTPFRTTKCYTE